jgi:hypothetical protein
MTLFRENLKKLVRVQDAILFLRRVKSVIEVKADEWTLPLLTTGD